MKILSLLYLWCVSIIPVAARRLGATTSSGNIVEVLSMYDNYFSTLVKLVSDNNLADTLATGGDFTVFAPTDYAFKKIESRLGKLTGPQVVQVLLYHVTQGKVLSSALSDGQVVPTLRSDGGIKDVNVTIKEQGWSWYSWKEIYINEATVTYEDIEASNGVIHIIDDVLVPEDLSSNFITDVLGDYKMFSTLSGLLDTYNLTDAVKSTDNLSLIAPTNAAFKAIENELKRLTGAEGAAKVTDILKYHVLGATVKSDQLVDGQSYPTLYPNDTVKASITETSWWWWKQTTVKLNDATVLKPDIAADNGVIHGVDKVLLPPSIEIPSTIVDIAAAEENFSKLVELLVSAGLVDTLKTAGPFTVFAPTNAAFDEIASVLPTLTPEQVKDVLLYHVVSAEAFSKDLSDGQTIETLSASNSVAVSISSCSWWEWHCSSSIKINESEVTKADIEASNGVIHVIDKVLLPPSVQPPNTIVDVAVATPTLSKLVELVGGAGLADTLKTPGPFTVFAPTNAAFDAIKDVLPTLTPEQVKNVLLYHVVSAKALSGSLSDGQSIATLQGTNVAVSIEKSGGWYCSWFGWYCETTIKINDSEVIKADVDASNGVVHVINKVLLPS